VQYGDIADPARWELFHMEPLNDAGLTLAGFNGALFDGRRVTFVPFGDCASGTVTSFDTTAAFSDTGGWSAFDLRTLNPDARGYMGGVFDGTRLILAPRCTTVVLFPENPPIAVTNGTVATHDVSQPFAAWQTHSAAAASTAPTGFRGAAFDGRYVYYAPASSGVVTRYDSTASPTAPGAFSRFDTATLKPSASTFTGAIYDGKYVYFSPGDGSTCTTVVARFDTSGELLNSAYWTTFDLKTVNASVSWCRFGGVFDGRFLYLIPYGSPLLVRLDTKEPFDAPGSWSVFEMATVAPNTAFFSGAGFDGRYVYFVPAAASKSPVVVRLDSGASFTDLASWRTFDLTTKDAAIRGFAGVAFDGRWIYLAPAGSPLTAARFDARSPGALPPTYKGSFL
jgi:hypothetical protein